MGKISVVINTLNEEHNLEKALDSVNGWVDEIIVVDMNSTDSTRDIARKYNAKVYLHERTGYVEPARNYAISKATNEWVLVIDADEKVGSELSKHLKNISENNNSADYYRIPRKNIIFGKWIKHSRWWPDYNIRFFKKGSVSWSEVIHSVPETKGRGMDLEPSKENAIMHYHYQSIDQYIERMNRYTSVYARNLKLKGVRYNWGDFISKPAGEFLSRFFQGEGYKDGVHGFVLASLQAVSEFVIYIKLWQYDKFPKAKVDLKNLITEVDTVQKDYNYWINDSLYKKTGSIINRFKRKFKLP